VTTFTVKNIPPDVYKKLKKSAETNRRSINSEIIVCIENTVHSKAIDPELILTNARKLRSHTKGSPITDVDLDDVKTVGRP